MDKLFIIALILIASIMLPLQLYTVMHAMPRAANDSEKSTWAIAIMFTGFAGVIIYFLMPISRRPPTGKGFFD